MKTYQLNNNVSIPLIGYGTYLTSPRNTEKLVSQALDLGYRHIDTAQNYGNEREVGLAVKHSGIPREEIFVTSKTQTSGFNATKKGIINSLKKSGLDYVDLMIIHWPTFDNLGTYKALEDAYKNGLVRAIGVSNFNSREIDYLLKNCEIKPVIDQIETHPYWQQQKMHKYLELNDIAHESWSPFGEGMDNIFNNKVITKIGNKYNKTAAQIILRFLIQNNIIVIPKSSNPEHMESNLDIFDFSLTDEEMIELRLLDKRKSYSGWPSSMQENSY